MTEEGGTKEEPVKEKVSRAWCLSKEEVESLGKVGILVESSFGSARDIEWAISNDNIFLLQARPITTEDKPTDYEIVHGLDSGLLTENEYLTIANVGEVFPGSASPF
ncbi:rifampicin phosphotransferase-like [Tachypleus tridentatus]|uniref:rifampicin phosphotransferase-like n=1 Tax=Tachypleus tridentatus TaxID=6853 RepID=UPI003FCEF622